RAEELVRRYDFIVSRAVTQMANFYPWVKNKFKKEDINEFPNGIFYLKGGDIDDEMEELNVSYVTYHLEDYFTEPFFDSKKVIYMPYEGRRSKTEVLIEAGSKKLHHIQDNSGYDPFKKEFKEAIVTG